MPLPKTGGFEWAWYSLADHKSVTPLSQALGINLNGTNCVLLQHSKKIYLKNKIGGYPNQPTQIPFVEW